MSTTLFGETASQRPKIVVEHSLEVINHASGGDSELGGKDASVSNGDVIAFAGESLYHKLVPFELVRSIGALLKLGLRGDIGGFLDVNVLALDDRLNVLKKDFQAGIDSNRDLFREALDRYEKDRKNQDAIISEKPDNHTGNTTDVDSRIEGPIIGQLGPYKIYDPNKIKVVGVVDIVGFLAPDMLERVTAGGPSGFREVNWVRYRLDRSVGRINSLILGELANQTIDAGYGINLNAVIHLANRFNIDGQTGFTNFLNHLSARAGVARIFGDGFLGGDTVAPKASPSDDFSIVKFGHWSSRDDFREERYGHGDDDRYKRFEWTDWTRHDSAFKARCFANRTEAGAASINLSSLGMADLVAATPFSTTHGPVQTKVGVKVAPSNLAKVMPVKRSLTESNSMPINNIDVSSFMTRGRAYSYIVAR